MEEKTLYYNIVNCGDGSAGLDWFEDEALARWVEERDDEGWAESCTGSVQIRGEFLNIRRITKPPEIYVGLLEEFLCGRLDSSELDRFNALFFDGTPPPVTFHQESGYARLVCSRKKGYLYGQMTAEEAEKIYAGYLSSRGVH
jgi:hypothetical protein